MPIRSCSFSISSKSINLMGSLSLRCVVTLTIVALLAICKTAEVTARASGAAEPHIHSPPRRRWPARLLQSVTASSIMTKLKHTSLGKRFYPQEFLQRASDRQGAVTDLFKTHNVKGVDVDRFFTSKRFKRWEKQVKKAYGNDAESMMFSTLNNELRYDDNGGVEAILAQAFKNNNPDNLVYRFEDLLLQDLADGMIRKRNGGVRDYVRYATYCESVHRYVGLRMGRMLDTENLAELIRDFDKKIAGSSITLFDYLEKYFEMINRAKGITDVFESLGPVKGFNNNAFLIEMLSKTATALEGKVDFANFMLTTLRKANWSEEKISLLVFKLETQKISSGVDPIIKAMANHLRSGGT